MPAFSVSKNVNVKVQGSHTQLLLTKETEKKETGIYQEHSLVQVLTYDLQRLRHVMRVKCIKLSVRVLGFKSHLMHLGHLGK